MDAGELWARLSGDGDFFTMFEERGAVVRGGGLEKVENAIEVIGSSAERFGDGTQMAVDGGITRRFDF